MKVKIKIRRCDPIGTGRCEPYLQAYEVEVSKGMTVLEALMWIKEHLDGSLSFRSSCRSAICGSCGVMVNGSPRLACRTQIIPEYEKVRDLTIAPLSNFRVIKDLVVDFGSMWSKINRVEPWLNPASDPPPGGWIITKDEVERIDGVSRCILCGICNSNCPSQEVDPNFIGPSASAKAYKFIGDVREGEKKRRLERLSGTHGIWDCARCVMCNEYCPKGVEPMTAIERLRAEAIREGIVDNPGARHVEALIDSVRRVGRLDEAVYTFRSLGLLRTLGMLPLGIRLELHGKMPHPRIFPAIEGIEEVRELIKSVEGEE